MGRVAIKVRGKALKVRGLDHSKCEFYKRVGEIINEAMELSAIGAEVAVIILSVYGVFTFGSPSVQFVIDKYLKQRGHKCDDDLSSDAGGDDGSTVNQSPQINKESHEKFWWRKYIDTLDLNQLVEFRKKVVSLKDDISKALDLQDAINKGEGTLSTSSHGFEKPGIDASNTFQGGGSSRLGSILVDHDDASQDGGCSKPSSTKANLDDAFQGVGSSRFGSIGVVPNDGLKDEGSLRSNNIGAFEKKA